MSGNYLLFYSYRHKLLALNYAIFGPLTMFLLIDMFVEKYTIYTYTLLFVLSSFFVYDAIAIYLKYYYHRIELTKEAIIVQAIFRKPCIIPWKKIIRITSQKDAINVISVDGDKIKVPTMIEGIPTLFARMKEEMLPMTAERALQGFNKWILAP